MDRLPEGWTKKSIGEFATVKSGGTPDRSVSAYWDGNIPWVTTGEVHFNIIWETREIINGRRSQKFLSTNLTC